MMYKSCKLPRVYVYVRVYVAVTTSREVYIGRAVN